MDPATVALFLAFSSAAAAAATGRLFGYPDDDHVIITQYGPMRYRPVTADEMNRPYDDDDGVRTPPSPAASPRGYYRAEVIPLDMKTWKPLSGGGGGGWVGRGGAGGGAAAAGTTRFDVPLRVGYSVQPTATGRPPVRRRRHEYYLLQGYQPPPPPQRHPGARSPQRPAAGSWRF